MCECSCKIKPERPAKPPPISSVLWEEEVARRTEGKLPPGYRVEHHRFGTDERTGLVVAIATNGSSVADRTYRDYKDSSSLFFGAYRETANSLVKKAWKNFLKNGY